MKNVKILLTGLLMTALLTVTVSPAYVYADELQDIPALELDEKSPMENDTDVSDIETDADTITLDDEYFIKEDTDLTDDPSEYDVNNVQNNLLKNGDGETGNISGWRYDYPGFDKLFQAMDKTDFFSRSDVSAHSGKYCLASSSFIVCYDNYKWKLSPYLEFSDDEPDESEVEMYQDVDISGFSAGTELILRGYVDLEGCMRADFYDRNGNLISENKAKDRSITDDKGWKYQRLSVKIPTNAVKIRIRLIAKFYRFVGGYGDPYGEYTRGAFDDISLCVKKPSDYKPTMAKTSGEILRNGGGENGNLDGWFYEYEDFTVFHSTGKTDFFSGSDVNPYKGSHCLASDFYWELAKTEEVGNYFLAELLSSETEKPIDSSVTMYQEVDLSPLPSGTKLKLSGYVSGEADISLTFFDAGRNLIGSRPSNKLDFMEKWDKRTVTVKAPANARYARVNLTAAYHGAAGGYGKPLCEYTRGAFDDISLKTVSTSGKKDIRKATVSGIRNKTYTGKKIKQSPIVKFGNKKLTAGKDYTVSYRNNKNAGKATVVITGKGNYKNSLTKSFTINKAANPLKVKVIKNSYPVQHSKLKKSAQTIKGSKIYKITRKGKGKKSYSLSSATKGKKSYKQYFAVNSSNGDIRVKKGLKKGKYSLKVKLTVKGNSNYKKGNKTVKVIVRVK